MTKSPYNFVSDERFQQLRSWLITHGYNTDSLTPLSADAGFRRYFRLQTDSGTLVAVDAPPEYEDTKTFLNVARRLSMTGLNTPDIHCYNLEKGFMLLSDLGSVHLQDIATPGNIELAKPLYADALHSLIKMQGNTTTDGLPVYSAQFLRQELDLFPEWYLQKHLQYNCCADTSSQLQSCFDLCIDSAQEQPSVFVHRDYHCRNLMIQSNNDIAIIDFQGAMAGPITYDLVSLLRDAYVEWPETFIEPMLKEHYQSLQTTQKKTSLTTTVSGSTTSALHANNAKTSMATYRRWFDLMGLQRHLKILGIFCRLHYRDGKSHYLDNIPLVLKHIKTVCLNYPEFSALHDLLMQNPQYATGKTSL